MFELINRYAQLKVLEEERDAQLKKEKALYEGRVKSIKNGYPDLDQQIEDVRELIQSEVLQNGLYERANGKAEIQFRPSWEIFASGDLVGWLNDRNKSELWDYTFKKAEINKICVGLDLAGLELPHGVQKTETPTLVITLPKYDTEPEKV